MPQNNETGYWWQGENARIASLAAAFAIGAHLADPSGELWYNTLFGMAYAQLDWILGKNPFGVTMMYGFGTTNYPNYVATRSLDNIKGGICNGISGSRLNANDLEWSPNGHDGEAWRGWRWIEQWLPHNAWYLTAVASISDRIDNPITPIVNNNPKIASHFKVSVLNGRNLMVELPFAATDFEIYNTRGQKIFSHRAPAGTISELIKIPASIPRGIYFLKAQNGKNYATGKVALNE
jgi:hypothetical protein